MTERRNKSDAGNNDAKLEALYRQARDVEPDAGLDRMIRARAEEASGAGRSSNRLPWLGGLVTASVAIVAIAVVLQQAPPGERSLNAPGVSDDIPEKESGGAFMSPSLGADAALDESPRKTQRARREVRQMQSAVEAQKTAPAPSSAALSDRAQSISRTPREAQASEPVAEQPSDVAESEPDASAQFAEDPDAILAHIRILIERGDLERARVLVEHFRREYPHVTVPEEIEVALARPD